MTIEGKHILMWAWSQLWPSHSPEQEKAGHISTEDTKGTRFGTRQNQVPIPTLSRVCCVSPVKLFNHPLPQFLVWNEHWNIYCSKCPEELNEVIYIKHWVLVHNKLITQSKSVLKKKGGEGTGEGRGANLPKPSPSSLPLLIHLAVKAAQSHGCPLGFSPFYQCLEMSVLWAHLPFLRTKP
jgi:hypothetical protein